METMETPREVQEVAKRLADQHESTTACFEHGRWYVLGGKCSGAEGETFTPEQRYILTEGINGGDLVAVPIGLTREDARSAEGEAYAAADALPVGSEQRRELLTEARELSDARHGIRSGGKPAGPELARELAAEYRDDAEEES